MKCPFLTSKSSAPSPRVANVCWDGFVLFHFWWGYANPIKQKGHWTFVIPSTVMPVGICIRFFIFIFFIYFANFTFAVEKSGFQVRGPRLQVI